MVDKQQPLLSSYQNVPSEEPFYYVLHFQNPYDDQQDSVGKLGRSIDKTDATELFHNAFKVLGVHTLSVTRFLSQHETKQRDPNYILEELNNLLQSQPGDLIDSRLFLEFILKSLLTILQQDLKFKVEMFRSRDNDEIFVKLWLSDTNLKIHADLIDYKLQLKLKEQTGEETQEHIPITPFASYAMYKPIPDPRDFSSSHQSGAYVDVCLDSKFKQYDLEDQEHEAHSVGENNLSIFSYKDKVRLIRDILSNAVDLEYLVYKSLMLAHYPIHKEAQLKELRSELVQPRFWRRTDIDKVRMYFGEQIALFYAWLEFYSIFMVIPAVLGLIVFIILQSTPNSKEFISVGEYSIIIYTILICLASSVVGRFWTRYENTLTFRWGVHNNNTIDPEQRPDYLGDYKVDTFTDKARKFYSEPTRVGVRRLINWILIIALLMLDLLIIWGFFRAVGSVKEANGNSYVLGTLIGIQIQIMIFLFSHVARWMNNVEMYETQAQYDEALTLKLFLFQFVNSYGSLLYIAFLRPHFEGCSEEGCIQELSNSLLMVLIVIFILSLLEMFAPFIGQKLSIWWEERKVKRMQEQGLYVENQPMRVEMSAVEEQAKLSTYKSTSDVRYIRNYMDVVTIYGYVVLFSSAFSLLPIIALVVNVVVIKVNSWRLCILCKRPYPEMVKSIGIWGYIISTLSLLGAFSNAGIMLLTYDIFSNDDKTWQIKCATFLSFEVLIIIFKFIVERAWSKTPSSVKQGMIWCDIYARENLNQRSASLQLRRHQWTLHPRDNENYSEIPFHIRHIHDDNPSVSRK